MYACGFVMYVYIYTYRGAPSTPLRASRVLGWDQLVMTSCNVRSPASSPQDSLRAEAPKSQCKRGPVPTSQGLSNTFLKEVSGDRPRQGPKLREFGRRSRRGRFRARTAAAESPSKHF